MAISLWFLVLGGALPALASEGRDTLQRFEVTLLGSTMGLGYTCVLRDPPPHGAWTVIYAVTEPRQSGLAVGQQVCEIVHSPSLHLRGLPSQETLTCQMVAGTTPPRFSCDGTRPTADMAVFGAADAARLEAEASAQTADLQARLEALTSQVPADCAEAHAMLSALSAALRDGEATLVDSVLSDLSEASLRAMCTASTPGPL